MHGGFLFTVRLRDAGCHNLPTDRLRVTVWHTLTSSRLRHAGWHTLSPSGLRDAGWHILASGRLRDTGYFAGRPRDAGGIVSFQSVKRYRVVRYTFSTSR